ncbi:MAG TPA: tetratricopeptide repeat protein [bacterium]|mgnify:CR=1 FL=1|nr:tetratricopeptide repeat protein [bacterium]
MHCENCGKPTGPKAGFCRHCGTKVKTPGDAAAEIIKDFRAGRYDSAALKLKNIEEGFEDKEFIRRAAGDIEFIKGRHAEALRNYSVIPKAKRKWDTLFNMALIKLNSNNPEGAASLLEEIKQADIVPQESLIYHTRYKGAGRAYADICLYLGVLYKNGGRDKEAVRAFKRALSADPKNELANANLGDIYFKNSDYDGAISCYRSAIETADDPMRKSRLYNDMGFACLRKGSVREAVESLKKAVMLNPANQNAVHNLGVIYVKKGMKDDVRDDYRELLKHESGIDIVFNLSKSIMDISKQEFSSESSVDFIGDSPVIKKVKGVILKAAETDSTVLIQGENGTGKELAARAIHKLSSRADKPFIVVNCGALPETLLESELFGYEKGAFTGAVREKQGRFELADKGVVFLDEISDITPAMQVKLLRVVQNREFERVGGTETKKVDIRIIAATNKELKKMVSEGKFREDLFYRLYVLPVLMPPLRQRGRDILMLAEYFLKVFSEKYGKSFKTFSNRAKEMLLDYRWPGNVRELENIIERVVGLYDDISVSEEHLPDELRRDSEEGMRVMHGGVPENEELFLTVRKNSYSHEAAARELGLGKDVLIERLREMDIETVLRLCGNSKSKAAKVLGINRSTLWRKMSKRRA